jgi:hypothetical protein
MNKDWYPVKEAERRIFLQNIVDVIDEVEGLMNVPKGTFKPLKEASQAELDTFATRDKARTAADTAQTNLETQEQLTETSVRANIKQIKNTVNLPADVLNLLHLNTPDSKPQDSVAAEVPLLKLNMEGIHPRIRCTKYGYDSVEVWCCRGDETVFTLLENVTHFPYFDNRDNLEPTKLEQRNYHAFYKKRNAVVSAEGPTSFLLVPGGSHK